MIHQELLTKQEQLDQAAAYIKQLKERIDELKVKKEVLALMSQKANSFRPISAKFTVPVVELRDSGSSNIESLVVSGLENNIRLCDVISVLQEEGANVVSANISRIGDRVFHTVHAQVGHYWWKFPIKLNRISLFSSRFRKRIIVSTILINLIIVCREYICLQVF